MPKTKEHTKRRKKKPAKIQGLATTALVYELKSQGYGDPEIATQLGIDLAQLREVCETMLTEKAHDIAARSKEVVYADYCLKQDQNLYALDGLIEELDSKTQYNAMIGAIRLRSDIHDKKIKVGQDLGVLHKAAEQTLHTVQGGIAIADMSTKDLRHGIAELAKNMGAMVAQFGDRKYDELPTGDLYYGPSVPDIVTSGVEVGSPAREKPKKKKKKRKSRRVSHAEI